MRGHCLQSCSIGTVHAYSNAGSIDRNIIFCTHFVVFISTSTSYRFEFQTLIVSKLSWLLLVDEIKEELF